MAISEASTAFQGGFEARLFADRVLCVLAMCGILLSSTGMLYNISKTALKTGFTTSLAILSSMTIADLLLVLSLSVQAIVLFGIDVQMSCATWYLSGAFSVFVHPFVSSMSLVVLSMALKTRSRVMVTSCGNTFCSGWIYGVTPWLVGLGLAWPLSVFGTDWRFCTNNFTTERQAAQILFCILIPVTLAVISSIMVRDIDMIPNENSVITETTQKEENNRCEKPKCYKCSLGENVRLRLLEPVQRKCSFQRASQPNHLCLDNLLCCDEKNCNVFAETRLHQGQYPAQKRALDGSSNVLNLHTDQCRLVQYKQRPHEFGRSHHNLQLHHRQEVIASQQQFFDCPQCLCPRQSMTRHSHHKYMTSQVCITTVANNSIKYTLPSVSLTHLVCTLPFALLYLIKVSGVVATTESFAYIITNQLCMWIMYFRSCLAAAIWVRTLSRK